MWNRKNKHDAFVIIITPGTIFSYHLVNHPRNTPIKLISHHFQILDRLEVERAILFNPTSIGDLIYKWYRPLLDRSVPMLLAINGPSIFSKIIATSYANPCHKQLNLPPTPHMQWTHQYLYSHEHRHYFYVCGMPQSILLQLKLIAIRKQLPLYVISSEEAALLNLYHHLWGTKFSHRTMGIELLKHHNHPEELFLEEDIYRIVAFDTNQTVAKEQHISLLTACGLFMLEGWQ